MDTKMKKKVPFTEIELIYSLDLVLSNSLAMRISANHWNYIEVKGLWLDIRLITIHGMLNWLDYANPSANISYWGSFFFLIIVLSLCLIFSIFSSLQKLYCIELRGLIIMKIFTYITNYWTHHLLA